VCRRQILEPLDGGHSLFFNALNAIPDFVYRGSFLSKTDDKSGYDHILLSEDSQQYFGIEWQGWWLVDVTLPLDGRILRTSTKRWD